MIPRARSRRAAARAAALALALLAGACARKAPPSGGPPDIVPPRVIGSVPDSGAARVPRDARLSITFSEGMEPRSTGEAVALAPRVEIRQRRWSGRTLTLVLDEPLRERQTYTLFVGNTARDRHGNAIDVGHAIVFSTADTFPTGTLEGKIEAKGFEAAGTYLWCYGGGRTPDSTARDFDALGLAAADGSFRIPGLPVPGSYRLWAFADLNHNRSFEPNADVLAPLDTTLALTPARPVAAGLLLLAVNPRAPGRVRGTVVDSTGDTLGVLRVAAVSVSDTTHRILTDPDAQGAFALQLEAGRWALRAFRDHDRNRAWRVDTEPASAVTVVDVPPATEVTGVSLRLRGNNPEPSGP